MRVGLISDTHGLLRPDVHRVFAGVDVILHAGDVCGDDILLELGTIAPVHAVRGNCDDPWDPSLPESRELELGGVRIHLQHGHELGRPKAPRVGAAYAHCQVAVYGHTHVPVIEQVGDTLVVNPGAAGPKRFDLTPTVALLTITDGVAHAELVSLAE